MHVPDSVSRLDTVRRTSFRQSYSLTNLANRFVNSPMSLKKSVRRPAESLVRSRSTFVIEKKLFLSSIYIPGLAEGWFQKLFGFRPGWRIRQKLHGIGVGFCSWQISEITAPIYVKSHNEKPIIQLYILPLILLQKKVSKHRFYRRQPNRLDLRTVPAIPSYQKSLTSSIIHSLSYS